MRNCILLMVMEEKTRIANSASITATALSNVHRVIQSNPAPRMRYNFSVLVEIVTATSTISLAA